jgi:diguanylate cyclase (GGDEF)-like protein
MPTAGSDEFAERGREFNRMSAELEQRLEDLRAEQMRLAGARRSIGEAVASNLDRDALLKIVLDTSVDAGGATGGRAALQDAPGEEPRTVAVVGGLGGLEAALSMAEADALRTAAPAEAHSGGTCAIAHPLRIAKGDATISGFVSVARSDRQFTEPEREAFADLARQAAGALENVGLHETVERQAVTDELTGLANYRHFQETLATELERSRRFEGSVALVTLDIDNFKRVNDAHGHAVGDLVLREIGRIVRDSSRGVDTPARPGGEELAMVLPETDLDGAYNLAERVRRRIADLALPLPGGGELCVTASFGVATHPDSAGDADDLVKAADEAMYAAKGSGKNRTVRAPHRPPA